MLALTIANLKMMARNRQTTFWALFFPLILVVAFGLFDFTAVGASDVAVIDSANTPASRQLAAALEEVEIVRLREPPATAEDGRRLIAEGDLDFLVTIPPGFGAASPASAGTGEDLEPVTLTLGAVRTKSEPSFCWASCAGTRRPPFGGSRRPTCRMRWLPSR